MKKLATMGLTQLSVPHPNIPLYVSGRPWWTAPAC
ncbi:hypothetical protein FHW77_000892 [Agrobacterium sp. RC10-4-1]|nr:hypothetical protein [Agrobacterium sp. RC10-4-1]MDP9774514.1 hypothetical protein [Rhizobium sp. SORGH_AS_0755]